MDGLPVRLDHCVSTWCRGFSWYGDREFANRLANWLIPMLILARNVHLAPLGLPSQLWTILHLFGDPVDSLLSLQRTLNVRPGAERWAQK